MLMATDKFRLESDTSKMAAKAAVLQFQQGQWVLTCFHSKKIPQAVCKYGIPEFEITDLV